MHPGPHPWESCFSCRVPGADRATCSSVPARARLWFSAAAPSTWPHRRLHRGGRNEGVTRSLPSRLAAPSRPDAPRQTARIPWVVGPADFVAEGTGPRDGPSDFRGFRSAVAGERARATSRRTFLCRAHDTHVVQDGPRWSPAAKKRPGDGALAIPGRLAAPFAGSSLGLQESSERLESLVHTRFQGIALRSRGPGRRPPAPGRRSSRDRGQGAPPPGGEGTRRGEARDRPSVHHRGQARRRGSGAAGPHRGRGAAPGGSLRIVLRGRGEPSPGAPPAARATEPARRPGWRRHSPDGGSVGRRRAGRGRRGGGREERTGELAPRREASAVEGPPATPRPQERGKAWGRPAPGRSAAPG